MFDLDNITVEFPPGSSDAVRVLDRITFAVEPGEYVAVVGPNGCGKSTLLQCIAGLVPFVAGRRRVGLPGGGETPVGPVQTDESSPETQAPESEAGGAAVLSLLLQEPDDHFVASRVDYELWLSIPLSMTESDGRVRVAEAIDRFSLHGLEGRNPHRLSGGEKQRLALAIAWVSDPDLLLLDEPTAYLDGEQGERCRAFVRTLNEDGVTVVWAALEANAVPDADRVVYLAEGKIRFDGTPASYQEWAPRAGTDPPVTLSETGGVAGATVAGSQMPFMKPPRVVERTRYPVVALDRVGFSYGDSGAQPAVLTDVSLEVRGGEAVGITGRNGAGKSTLLAVMSGILQPTAGRIERAYARAISGRQQNVFHMFQSPESLFFAETVAEEIAFGLRALGYAEDAIAGRIDDALERFEMDPARYRERSPFHLSFGEMRRVAFAIAEVLEPRFLLLDEPTSCLDRDGWALLAGLIGRVNDRGGAVVLASHDPVVIDALTHRSVSLDR